MSTKLQVLDLLTAENLTPPLGQEEQPLDPGLLRQQLSHLQGSTGGRAELRRALAGERGSHAMHHLDRSRELDLLAQNLHALAFQAPIAPDAPEAESPASAQDAPEAPPADEVDAPEEAPQLSLAPPKVAPKQKPAPAPSPASTLKTLGDPDKFASDMDQATEQGDALVPLPGKKK